MAAIAEFIRQMLGLIGFTVVVNKVAEFFDRLVVPLWRIWRDYRAEIKAIEREELP